MRAGAAHVPARLDRRLTGLVLVMLLALTFMASVSVGVSALSATDSLRLFLRPDASPESALVWQIRVPRAALSVLVGANLAVAGLLIQTLTRNALASPQTFGINAGAALAIVIFLILFPGLRGAGTVWPAFAGAGAVGVMMWMLSASGMMSELRLALAGISVQLVLAALVQAILIANNAAQDIVYWLAGSVNGAQWQKVQIILPFTLGAGLVALLGGRQFGVLALDSTTRASLGQNARRTGAVAAMLIVLLAGSAVAVSGPIGFIGLIVPHLMRRIVGSDHTTLIAFSAGGGALLLCLADLMGRLLAFPSEIPVGIITALIGAPVFLMILYTRQTGQPR